MNSDYPHWIIELIRAALIAGTVGLVIFVAIWLWNRGR